MINKHTEKILEEKDVIDSVICNRCGKPIHTTKSRCGDTMYVDYLHFKDNVIFRQRLLSKLEDFDLCEDCINAIISEFKIPVEKFEL